MGNPNTSSSLSLRRRNSLPMFHPRKKTRIISAKSNPYVGWFRYSPSFSSKRHANRHFLCDPKSSPYTGWFRHAPPCSHPKLATIHRSIIMDYLEKELPRMLQAVPARDANGLLVNLEELFCTHLKGGAPDSSWNKKKNEENQMSSVTSSILKKVSCWLLETFRNDETEFMVHYNSKIWEASLEGRNDKDSSSDDDSLSSSVESSACSQSSLIKEDSSIDHKRKRSSSISSASSSMMVSSQAEAHYAHSLLTSRTRSGLTTSAAFDASDNDLNATTSGFLGRLDYNITQMDIMRMTRNASRHLDVESILKLPTVTYQKPQTSVSSTQNDSTVTSKQEVDSNQEEWSWMLVPGGKASTVSAVPPSKKAKDVKTKDTGNQEESALKDELAEEKDICVICLEHFVNGDRLRVLPCDHSFHISCVDHWLSGSQSFQECYTAGCPTCKQRPDQPILARSSESAVPSWAFARIGNALARRDSSRECLE